MSEILSSFLIQWVVTALSLWVASYVFRGVRFADAASLIVSALLLGFANAIVRPILILLTLPLTLVTLGLFLLVINALMLLLVAAVVRGFSLSGFWTAFFASIFITLLGLVFAALFIDEDVTPWRPAASTVHADALRPAQDAWDTGDAPATRLKMSGSWRGQRA